MSSPNFWTVLGKSQTRPGYTECICICGKRKEVSTWTLKTGQSKSCGCRSAIVKAESLSINTTESVQRTIENNLYLKYKKNAQYRSKSFSLSKDKFLELLQQPCFYCGADSANTVTREAYGMSHVFTYSGIDRLDSSQGYEDSNCVACCKKCNYAKGKMTASEFIEMAVKIAELNSLTKINDVIQ